ncbi:hypothetical protein Syun_025681 [Stephania yunnanensis]|uniref:Polygalacturonase n=1 Tax=Stephania yunnanensis TaxID=152371 RepID=A0AAP0ESV8_9MAGN
MASNKLIFFLVLFTISIASSASTTSITTANKLSSFNVVKFGAKADGKTDSTGAFSKAWAAACNSLSPPRLYVPRGTYLIKRLELRGPCKSTSRTTVQIDGTLVAPSDYRQLGNSGNLLLFIKISGLSVIGGTIDARGAAYWGCTRNCPPGARSITFNNVRNLVVSGLMLINSQVSHMVISGCTNAVVSGVKIRAPDQSPNTDGIHIQTSTGVTIKDSAIRTGDDCISIGPGTKKLFIQGISCGPGHGISIGSLARDVKEEGVEDVTVKNVSFSGSDNGLRIKSWARPSNGYVRGVTYHDITMNNVKNPIIIDQRYCPEGRGCPNQSSGIKISQVTYRNIRGTSATPVAVNFQCSATNPCIGIRLQNVKLGYSNSGAKSSCVHAHGTSSGVVAPASCF